MNDLNKLLSERNKVNDCKDTLWIIKNTDYGGRGVFAVRDIRGGEIIFTDIPIIIGPRSTGQLPGCSVCLVSGRPLTACPNGCCLPICYGKHCEQSPYHQDDCKLLSKLTNNNNDNNVNNTDQWSPQYYKYLALFRCLNVDRNEKEIIRQLYASDSREANSQARKMILQLKRSLPNSLTEEMEEWLIHCCGVFDGTSFEVPNSCGDTECSLRGLYPLAAMMNHSCCPNTTHYFTTMFDIEKDRMPMMIVKATVNISQGTEITTTYCPQLWSTLARRQFLLVTKHFLCNCCRCQDPTEFGTNLSAMKCDNCNNGLLLPKSSLDLDSEWICNLCPATVKARTAILTQTRATLMNIDDRNAVLAPSNYINVQTKFDKIWKESKNITSLSDAELFKNEAMIRDLLSLLTKLSLQKSKRHGFLLMELYKTIDELSRRKQEEYKHVDELTKLWTNANAILEGDLPEPKIRRY